jgi:hypothetical protein
MNDRLTIIWDYIVEMSIATEDELRLVTSINGTNEDSLNSVLYSRTGYRSMEQIIEMEGE